MIWKIGSFILLVGVLSGIYSVLRELKVFRKEVSRSAEQLKNRFDAYVLNETQRRAIEEAVEGLSADEARTIRKRLRETLKDDLQNDLTDSGRGFTS